MRVRCVLFLRHSVVRAYVCVVCVCSVCVYVCVAPGMALNCGLETPLHLIYWSQVITEKGTLRGRMTLVLETLSTTVVVVRAVTCRGVSHRTR